ncbi:MAG: hypothetical protein JO002_05175, partial [Burkholderiaceae bacterium]|nr:hypothetical protein [Burkholderiaceae bacterium]
ELRENRVQCLQQYGQETEEELHQAICDGALAEHPAYDHYLSAKILASTRAAVREQLRTVSAELGAL